MDVRLSDNAAAVFQKVCKVYQGSWRSRGVVALADVTLSVRWGEVLGLIGPNRAGKTTLVKTLLSICHPTSGRIMRLGAPLSDRSTLSSIGYVHENPSFPRYLTASQVLSGYGHLAGVRGLVLARRSADLLERVGLADRSRETIARFSKGMLQRLALAQALINDPKLLVLDEPSEGMDLTARRLLDETICERRAAGHSVVLVSHALENVGRLCDRVAILRSGRLVFLGNVEELAPRNLASGTASLEDAVEPLYEEALA
ncbi:MAG TPA: ABC transporter ATP-binding protein [Pirellulales bacterium]|nr:ABC transporter ATP-binding protein [Pirellulales bacterium]